MKKTYRMMIAAASAICLASANILPAAAGTLSAQELFRKYDYSGRLLDESGAPVTAYDVTDLTAAQAMEYFTVFSAGFDRSYPDSISDLPTEQNAVYRELRINTHSTYSTFTHAETDPETGELIPIEVHTVEELDTFITYPEITVSDAVIYNDYRGYDTEYSVFRYKVDTWANRLFAYVETENGCCIVGMDDAEFAAKKTDTLTIPDAIGGLPVTEIADGAFAYPEGKAPKGLRRIVLPDSVAVIGWHAFDGAIAADTEDGSIHLPAALKTLKPYAFRNVGQYLDTDQYPESLEFIGRGAVAPNIPMKLPQSPVMIEEPSRTIIHFNADGKADTIAVNTDGALRLSDAAAYYRSDEAAPDVNRDGVVDVRDAVLLSRAVGGDVSLSGTTIVSDLNGDGKTDAADLLILLRRLARLTEE